MPVRKLVKSFGYGFRGIWVVFCGEQNMRVHGVAALVVVVAGIGVGLERWEWTALVLAISGVMVAECLNTAMERLADRVTREQDEWIGMAKDAAAGGVLLAAIGAAVVGGIVFLPRVISVMNGG